MRFLAELEKQLTIPEHYKKLLANFYGSYRVAIEEGGMDPSFQEALFLTFLDLIKKECDHPFTFAPYHKQIRTPFDYYAFGLNFTRPLLYKDASSIVHEERLAQIQVQIEKGENVVLLANHQTELDPQIIGCLLEDKYPRLAAEMIFVAGQKVITDLLAIPFSMGCNLLCIHSRRHIDNDPHLKLERQQHNQKTMKLMSGLLREGGKCIYVAPSGGRDRPNAQGIVEVAPFDPDSIEMFRLMALQSKTATHFYPLALSTYDVLPPPASIEKGVGEKRLTTRSPVHICFGPEADMEMHHLDGVYSKHEKRFQLAKAIWEQVNRDYQRLKS